MVSTDDEDEDSLFGSPRPEVAPAISRGRSPSPLLALPGISTTTLSLLPAISVSTAASRTDGGLTGVCQTSIGNSQNSDQPNPPQPRPQNRSRTQKRNSQKSSKSTKKSSTRTSTPQIQIPDASTKLPPNFLRNQSALLGLAGLVGRIKPATLLHGRGTTRENPIVLDGGSSSKGEHGRYTPPSTEAISAELPTLTTEEIVEALVNEKDTLRLLEGILKMHSDQSGNRGIRRTAGGLSTSAATQGSLFHATSIASSQPPHKKRKLYAVPAGAADWDVPYPFAPGEGPEWYHEKWEETRGRKLVKEFVELVKGAAEKAAKRKLVKRNLRHYRPETTGYGLAGEMENGGLTTQSPSLFDFSDISDGQSTPWSELNQDFLDNWISMLDNFPDLGVDDSTVIDPQLLAMDMPLTPSLTVSSPQASLRETPEVVTPSASDLSSLNCLADVAASTPPIPTISLPEIIHPQPSQHYNPPLSKPRQKRTSPTPTHNTRPPIISRSTPRFTSTQKQNILQRSKERLMLLKAEYERAKVEFWECGLEHACMVQMGKELARGGTSS